MYLCASLLDKKQNKGLRRNTIISNLIKFTLSLSCIIYSSKFFFFLRLRFFVVFYCKEVESINVLTGFLALICTSMNDLRGLLTSSNKPAARFLSKAKVKNCACNFFDA